MIYKTINTCRLCGSRNLRPILNLGKLCLTGTFPFSPNETVPRAPLELVLCDACSLLQLQHSVNLHLLFGNHYGFRSGINSVVRNHLASTARFLNDTLQLSKHDILLDIGSNDGTFLSFFPSQVERIGIDPSGSLYQDLYSEQMTLMPSFFDKKAVQQILAGKRAKAVTSLAMLYDIEDPVEFAGQVRDVLDDEGIWVIELSYAPLMLKNISYDNICHEHVCYFGLTQLEKLAQMTGFKIVRAEINSFNGGSLRLALAKTDSRIKPRENTINKLPPEFSTHGAAKSAAQFAERVFSHREKLLETLEMLKIEGKKVIGLGASTKGNVLLQFCGIGPQTVPAIMEIQANKIGRMTPGTHIPIIDERRLSSLYPDVLFVLPWAFRQNFIKNQSAFLKAGGVLFFPFPGMDMVRRQETQISAGI